ncbi:sensor histidine kinase [Paenibacillus daejeonensis]|uniref:sensor histidine kinase n=1 Tax=Paenibacillus daejeonensis TaxID=135193 RepID=UPI00037A78C7|nr:sensor histidine kinase [Paenibacillus daejeonensis]
MKWYQILQRNTGLSPYVWVVFYILPFYFVFSSTSMYQTIVGGIMIVGFFICYVLSFISRGWLVYVWTTMQLIISVTMTLWFGYVYFAIFLAFFIGNIKHRVGFYTLYSLHLMTTLATINFGLLERNPVIISQLPFVLVSLIAVILLPVTTYHRNKSDQLEGQLQHANKRISELVKMEERQRIARDLHDTLGQKLSLIGLKSDLAGKLVHRQPSRAMAEMADVSQTARSALKEVRKLVTEMRGVRLEEEVHRIRQILLAAGISFELEGDPRLGETSLLNENVVTMCLKEAVTNVVRHSEATACKVRIEQSPTEVEVEVHDNGRGIELGVDDYRGHGLQGMRERLEFVNGRLDIRSEEGTSITFTVPNILQGQKTISSS